MAGKFDMDKDYVTVAQRIVEFRVKYPEGSLQPLNLDKPYEMVQMGNTLVFIVVAAAYRTPDDTRPGIGMAYEPIPGSTPFTRGSELQNAETAAWGRALIAVLAADTKSGVASFEEVLYAKEREKQEARAALGAPVATQRDVDTQTHTPQRPTAPQPGQQAAEQVLGATLESENPNNAVVQPMMTDMQKAWLLGEIGKMDDETKERYQVMWHEANLPALKSLTAEQFNVASGLLPPAAPRKGTPQPGFYGRNPNGGDEPYYEGANDDA